MATIQWLEVTHEQTSTLFWINVAVGALLTVLCAALAPLLVAFYNEPRLYWVVVVSGVAFMFNGLAAQHRALLQRSMRFQRKQQLTSYPLRWALRRAWSWGRSVSDIGLWWEWR